MKIFILFLCLSICSCASFKLIADSKEENAKAISRAFYLEIGVTEKEIDIVFNCHPNVTGDIQSRERTDFINLIKIQPNPDNNTDVIRQIVYNMSDFMEAQTEAIASVNYCFNGTNADMNYVSKMNELKKITLEQWREKVTKVLDGNPDVFFNDYKHVINDLNDLNSSGGTIEEYRQLGKDLGKSFALFAYGKQITSMASKTAVSGLIGLALLFIL